LRANLLIKNIAIGILTVSAAGCGLKFDSKTENSGTNVSVKVENTTIENNSKPVNASAGNKAPKPVDLKKVNFENYTFVIKGEKVKMKDGLQAGACQGKDEDGDPVGDIWNISKENIAFGDLDGDGNPEAFMSLYANVCGGNMGTDDAVLVFTGKDGKITPLPVFDYSDDPCEAGEKDCKLNPTPGVTLRYDGKEKAIVVKSSFATADDAFCCPSFYREIWFKWNGSEIVELKKGKITKNETGN
jgi:hypothetical protein